MARSLVLSGAHIKIYINGIPYKVVQSISFSVDYGEAPIYGIDAAYAQEIAPGKIVVSGSIMGLRMKQSGGLQGSNMRPAFNDFAASPYISLRIQDRQSGDDILFIPNAKVTRESHSISTRSTYRLNFDFIGQIPFFDLDRA